MARNQAKDMEKIIEALTSIPIVELACRRVGLPRSTYYRWRNDNTNFQLKADEAIKIGSESYNDLAESKLMELIQHGDFRAIQYYLNHRHPKYKNTNRSEPDIELHGLAQLAIEAEKILREKENQK